MKKSAVLIAMSFFTVVVLLVAFGPKGDGTSPSVERVVGNRPGQTEMLESDQRMLERMRESVSPNMGSMIEQNPMWVDPDMIRLQEENQAQLDRMLGRRPGQP